MRLNSRTAECFCRGEWLS